MLVFLALKVFFCKLPQPSTVLRRFKEDFLSKFSWVNFSLERSKALLTKVWPRIQMSNGNSLLSTEVFNLYLPWFLYLDKTWKTLKDIVMKNILRTTPEAVALNTKKTFVSKQRLSEKKLAELRVIFRAFSLAFGHIATTHWRLLDSLHSFKAQIKALKDIWRLLTKEASIFIQLSTLSQAVQRKLGGGGGAGQDCIRDPCGHPPQVFCVRDLVISSYLYPEHWNFFALYASNFHFVAPFQSGAWGKLFTSSPPPPPHWTPLRFRMRQEEPKFLSFDWSF